MLLVFSHVSALAIALGGSFFLWLFLNTSEDRLVLAKLLRRFHPVLLGCHGTLIMTGAWMVTGRKIGSGVHYFQQFGQMLGIKLIVVFLAMLVASYQFFGLGTVIVAMIQGETDAARLPDKLVRLRYVVLIHIGLLLVITYMGLTLARM